MICYSHLLKNFPQFVVIHTVKGFCVGSEAEVDVFLEFPCFLYDTTNVGNLISCSSAFSKSSLFIWKFLTQVLLKCNLKDFEHKFTSIRNKHNSMVVGTILGIYFLCNWDELTFSSPVATAESSKYVDILSAAV